MIPMKKVALAAIMAVALFATMFSSKEEVNQVYEKLSSSHPDIQFKIVKKG